MIKVKIQNSEGELKEVSIAARDNSAAMMLAESENEGYIAISVIQEVKRMVQ